MNITILTPAYNRGYVIDKLYKSLVKQTNQNFEWLIIDDGSTDNTQNIVNKFISEKKINITYIYQENGGKHRALNKGISMIENELTFIVDSDDYLTEDAIETINEYYEKYKNRFEICGYSFLRCFPNKEVIGKKFNENEYISNYVECRLNKKIEGDKAEVYYTKYLKEIPFLEIENEKFLFEDYVWIQLAEKYDMIHINKAIYVCDYLNDGLTKNGMILKLKSPIGMTERGLVYIYSTKTTLVVKIKGMIHYIAYNKLRGKKLKEQYKYLKKFKCLFILTCPMGVVYYLRLKNIKF